MGKTEDLILEMVEIKIQNHKLTMKIEKKLGNDYKYLKYKIYDLENIKTGIMISKKISNKGVKFFIDKLYSVNKKLQRRRNKVFNSII